jgi:hypothetical protein
MALEAGVLGRVIRPCVRAHRSVLNQIKLAHGALDGKAMTSESERVASARPDTGVSPEARAVRRIITDAYYDPMHASRAYSIVNADAYDALARTVEELRDKLAATTGREQAYRQAWQEQKGERDQAQAELREARAALLKYGDHTNKCNDDARHECICGFDAALKSKGSGPAEPKGKDV